MDYETISSIRTLDDFDRVYAANKSQLVHEFSYNGDEYIAVFQNGQIRISKPGPVREGFYGMTIYRGRGNNKNRVMYGLEWLVKGRDGHMHRSMANRSLFETAFAYLAE